MLGLVRLSCFPVGAPALACPLVRLIVQVLPECWPDRLPLPVVDNRSQGQHRRDILAGPMHASPLETLLDHKLVGTLHRTAPNRIPLVLKGGIGNLVPSPTQVPSSRIPHLFRLG